MRNTSNLRYVTAGDGYWPTGVQLRLLLSSRYPASHRQL